MDKWSSVLRQWYAVACECPEFLVYIAVIALTFVAIASWDVTCPRGCAP